MEGWNDRKGDISEKDEERRLSFLNAASTFLRLARRHGIEAAHKVCPPLEGCDVMRLCLKKRGWRVGRLAEETARWVLGNPGGTREECEAHVLRIGRDEYDRERIYQ